MPMKYPPHPGLSIKFDCLEPLGLSITEGAKVLGVARSTLSRVINGQASITPEMAIRLAKAFGSTAETWLKMQQAYDLSQMHAKENEIVVERYQPKEPEKALV
jgi:antitoxin HigA-1